MNYRQALSPDQSGHFSRLVGLDVEEKNIRLIPGVDRAELRKQHLTREVKIQQQECSETERDREQQGAIIGAIEIGQALTEREIPVVRKKLSHQNDEEFCHARENADGEPEDGGENHAAFPGFALRDGEGGDARGHDEVDQPNRSIEPARLCFIRHAGTQNQQRRQTSKAQKRREREENADAETDQHAAENRLPRDRG